MRTHVFSSLCGSVAILAFAFVTETRASTLYSNDFDTLNGGLSAQGFTGFPGLTVSSGSVNLVHTGDGSGITCEGSAGGCVDLGGDTNQNGDLLSTSYGYSAGDTLTLSLGASGSQRFTPGTAGFSFGFNFSSPTSGSFAFSDSSGFLFGDVFTDETQFGIVDGENTFDTPFDDLSLAILPTSPGSLTFFVHGYSPDPADTNNDDFGAVVDNLSLVTSAVPEPATWTMMLFGLGGVGFAMRRRQPSAKVFFTAWPSGSGR